MRSSLRPALCSALCVSSLAFAAGPAAVPPKAAGPAEYPATCNAAARPLLLSGLDANFNAQIDAARDLFKKAIAADAKCAQAKAQLSVITQGAEGKALMDEAVALAATLSEVEKSDVLSAVAMRGGEAPKAFELAKKANALVPNVLFFNIKLSFMAGDMQKFDEQLAASKKATELDPKSGAAWNLLGYAHTNLGKTDDAVAAFRKYAEVSPNEPNAHDSLADALLRAGKLDEAGAAYQKAIDSSGGKFWLSYDGVATVKAHKGEWDAAREALARRLAAATDPTERAFTQVMVAWTWQSQLKPAEALKVLDAMAKDAAATKNEFGALYAQVTRGFFQVQNGKFADALKSFAAAEKLGTENIPGAQKRWATLLRLTATVEAYARTNKIPAAEKALAELEEASKAAPGDPTAADFFHLAKGLLLVVKKDLKGAVAELQATTNEADLAKLALADEQDAAGDPNGAAATRAALAQVFHRNPFSWYAHAQLEARKKIPGKKTAGK